jgi:hypothetical protein
VTAMATTPVPSPLAVTGIVDIDIPSRTLTVMLSDAEQGVPRLLWKESYAALRRSEESGWRTAHPYVWGGALGNRQIIHGQPGDYLTLLFCFPAGERVYAKLVGTPRLAAIVTADREQRRFLSVRFLNRP